MSLCQKHGLSLLPAGLHYARNLSIQGQLAETQTAHTEFPQITARPPAPPAAVAMLALKPGLLGAPGRLESLIFCDFGGSGHIFFSLF